MEAFLLHCWTVVGVKHADGELSSRFGATIDTPMHFSRQPAFLMGGWCILPRRVLRPDVNGEPMDESQIAKRLEILRVEHRDLDSAIAALFETSSKDQLQLARLKKRKLRLRDEISMLEDQLIPDIIA
jgi:hypothetical protein